MPQEYKNAKDKKYVIRIGPLLKRAIDEQKKPVKEYTHGVCELSDYESGEIIGKKILGLSE